MNGANDHTNNEEEDKKKVTLRTQDLPTEVQTAQQELCRLHREREPHNDVIKRITKEMEMSKAVLKAFCLEQKEKAEKMGPSAIVAQTTSFEAEDTDANPIRVNCVAKIIQPVPTAEDVYSVTGQVLNKLQQRLCKEVLRDLANDETTAALYKEKENQISKVVAKSLQLGAMQLLSIIRKEAAQVAGGPKVQYSIGMSEVKTGGSGGGGGKKRKMDQ